ncbi:MAG: crossover junction endodeoxyribonuclease RuvC [Candidatus Atribacteria bacterium]|jgi:crossover junction endodeoxyribonuclease RuvC|nr:crossover junction endodeoxyribonuclease RuvC [Candidatus Atribacteria bacterium]MDI3530554.1 crossover junction endodeoxyribonuclease RuvC [Candidatus Atribacteria bacterium]
MFPDELIFLGVDPGTATTGVGVVAFEIKTKSFKPLFYDVITTSKSLSAALRLREIFEAVNHFIQVFSPHQMVVEELFFNRNVKTALSVGEARGVVLLCAALIGVPVFEYTPLEVKQAVVGYGRASKQQVIYMVRQILGISEEITPDDAADALALCVCHGFRLLLGSSNV